MALPLIGLQDLLFGNTPRDQAQGVEVWTDNSRVRDNGIIRVRVTPQDFEFNQQARISEQKIKAGRAFYFWRKDRFSNHLDLMEVRIGGITASLLLEKVPTGAAREIFDETTRGIAQTFSPAVPTSPGGETRITLKQREWLRFWSITREPFTFEDGVNNHHLRLDTPALPIPVEFIGHFAGPVVWRHSARQPFLAQWELTLIVHRTSPDLDKVFEMANSVVVQQST
jgi:hypothetical protein